jgi:hypothetical protein
VVERPEDVRGAAEVEARLQCPLLVEDFDDRTLVVVELVLNPGPELVDLGVRRSGATHHLQQRADPRPDQLRVADVQLQLALGVRLVQDGTKPGSLAYGNRFFVASKQQMPERPQEAALGLERDVDRL